MRISGGLARGIPLRVPKGDHVRPATDGLRQAVFSSVASRLPDAHFADLFAGSGAYGLEALSRGAAGGCFVEKHSRTADLVRENLAAVCKSLRRPLSCATVINADVLTWSPSGPTPSLVFVDPPYPIIEDIALPLFARLTEWLRAVPDPVIVFEMPAELSLTPPEWTCVRRLGKERGQNPSAAFFRRTAQVTVT